MENQPIEKIVKKVLPAVVSITTTKRAPNIQNPFSPFGPENLLNENENKKIQVGGGSGFIVDSSGTILTNRHVVDDPDAEYTVILDEDTEYTAKILDKDPINDIAVLKIDAKELPFIELGDSSKLQLGQSVIAIGNTLGIFRNTVSTGVISGLSRYITAFNALSNKAQRLRGLIQTDAAINPGNSGGPLIDAQGKAIGINAAMISGAENVGFTLPINTAKNDLDDIKKHGRIRQPFLGLRYILLNKDLQKKYNFSKDSGALIISEDNNGMAVIPESPAYKAGIKESDIILEVCNNRIKNPKISIKNPLEDIIQKFKVGETINLKIFRQGKEIICKIPIGERI